ncbi:MAG: hypothetical protein K0Q50_1368 [Vampirovibrio sp.]|nr:hypothetical protein [Vampirovibrio sp.]
MPRAESDDTATEKPMSEQGMTRHSMPFLFFQSISASLGLLYDFKTVSTR